MTSSLQHVRVHGLGLTDDFLLTLSTRAQAASLRDATPQSYDLPPRTTIDEAVLDAWDDARKAWTKYQSHGQDVWNAWLRPLLKTMDYGFTGGGATGGRYTVRHLADSQDVPLHFTEAADLDRTNEESGLRVSPHGLMQGYLGASPDHLWGIVTNGEVLRVLRNTNQVTRPAYVEFRLGDLMNGEDARAFRLVWMLLHRTRLKGGKASLLEAWNVEAGKAGVKARDSLRDGVARATELIGTGILQRNPDLTARLASHEVTPAEVYRACLNLIYQLVFVFVVEDRDLLFARDEAGEYVADARTRERARLALTGRLRERALGQEGSAQHTDAFEGWQRLVGYLRAGFEPLGLPALGSDLFKATLLEGLKLGNQEFLAAVRALSEIEVERTPRPVNYAGLDSEELGSIYESLLEFVPQVRAGPVFRLGTLAGNERKTTGSYYTPSSLIDLLLDSALDPVIADAVAGKSNGDAIAALKGLKIIDPACGSGHFLIAAARRVGAKLAGLQENTAQPSPDALRRATRTVIAHCIYGTDINPMAIELAKVALWLESQESGKPLAFLDHRLRVGNALLGTAEHLFKREDEIPEQRVKGVIYPPVRAVTLHVPDEAFAVLEGDDKATVSDLKKRNKRERLDAVKANRGAQTLDFGGQSGLQSVSQMMRDMDRDEPETLGDVQAQEAQWGEIQRNEQLQHLRMLADAWCAAFVLPKTPGSPVVTTSVLHQLKASKTGLPELRQAVDDIVGQYKFFHTFVEFHHVHEQGGFDCVLGNPPWEQVQLDPQEFFAASHPEIAAAENMAAREKMIAALEHGEPAAFARYQAAKREMEGVQHFIHASGRYPTTSFGRLNTAPLFSELSTQWTNERGCTGIIVPTGIATDSFNQYFFNGLVDSQRLISLFDFENREALFAGVHRSFKFCTLTVGGAKRTAQAGEFVFFALQPQDVNDPEKRFKLSPEDIALLNPNTKTTPIFRSARDAHLTRTIYQRVPVLIREPYARVENGQEVVVAEANPWNLKFMLMFMMNTGSRIFKTAKQLEKDGWTLKGNRYFKDAGSNGPEQMFPLYEAKLMHQFDHRYATYTQEGDTRYLTSEEKTASQNLPHPRYWVAQGEVDTRLIQEDRDGNVVWSWERDWLMGFRDIARSTDERTTIASVEPRAAVGHSNPVFFTNKSPELQTALLSSFNSFALDYVVRQKVGGTHLNFGFFKQFPVLPPSTFTPALLAFITPRVLELTYTAHDLTGFARDLGYDGDSFPWDDERRFYLRAELDALHFILYGIGREDMEYIMETFPIVKKKDLAAHNAYRTKNEILAVYDQLTQLGLENLGHYVSAWDGSAEVPLGAEAREDDVFRQAVLNKVPSYPYILKTFHQTRVYNFRGFEQRRTVKDWEDIIEDAEP